jgi:hypothetical protein
MSTSDQSFPSLKKKKKKKILNTKMVSYVTVKILHLYGYMITPPSIPLNFMKKVTLIL